MVAWLIYAQRSGIAGVGSVFGRLSWSWLPIVAIAELGSIAFTGRGRLRQL
jgi:hypothetical protein